MADTSSKSQEDNEIADVMKQVFLHKLKRLLAHVIKAQMIDAFHQDQQKKSKTKKKVTEDEAPTNCMGAGQVATFDPMLFVNLARRKRPTLRPVNRGQPVNAKT